MTDIPSFPYGGNGVLVVERGRECIGDTPALAACAALIGGSVVGSAVGVAAGNAVDSAILHPPAEDPSHDPSS